MRKLLKQLLKDNTNFVYFKKGLKLTLFNSDRRTQRFSCSEPYFKYYLNIKDEKNRSEYRNAINNRIHALINTQDLDGLKTIAYLFGGYVDESYNEIFSNIEDRSQRFKDYVINKFNCSDFKNISTMIIVCNSTVKIIEDHFIEVNRIEYFNWVLSKVDKIWGAITAFHLSKKSAELKKLLSERIERGELDNTLIRIYTNSTSEFSGIELFNILKFHKKIVEILKGYENGKSCLSNLILYLLKIYDLENIKELVQNFSDLMNIFSESDIYTFIADGFKFNSASKGEIKLLFSILPIAKKVFNNNYSEDERNLILSKNI